MKRLSDCEEIIKRMDELRIYNWGNIDEKELRYWQSEADILRKMEVVK